MSFCFLATDLVKIPRFIYNIMKNNTYVYLILILIILVLAYCNYNQNVSKKDMLDKKRQLEKENDNMIIKIDSMYARNKLDSLYYIEKINLLSATQNIYIDSLEFYKSKIKDNENDIINYGGSFDERFKQFSNNLSN